MQSDNIPPDIIAMAETIIPDDSSHHQRELLTLAISYGVQMERERVEREKRLERFKRSIERFAQVA